MNNDDTKIGLKPGTKLQIPNVFDQHSLLHPRVADKNGSIEQFAQIIVSDNKYRHCKLSIHSYIILIVALKQILAKIQIQD